MNWERTGLLITGGNFGDFRVEIADCVIRVTILYNWGRKSHWGRKESFGKKAKTFSANQSI